VEPPAAAIFRVSGVDADFGKYHALKAPKKGVFSNDVSETIDMLTVALK
jgi:hypothetical protein